MEVLNFNGRNYTSEQASDNGLKQSIANMTARPKQDGRTDGHKLQTHIALTPLPQQALGCTPTCLSLFFEITSHAFLRYKTRLRIKSKARALRNTIIAYLRGKIIEKSNSDGRIIKFYNHHHYIFDVQNLEQTVVKLITVYPYTKVPLFEVA